MSGELPAEVQAVIDAALAWTEGDDTFGGSQLEADLERAVSNYRKATAPPEPFGIKVGYDEAGDLLWVDEDHTPFKAAAIWHCIITPIERVR